MLVAVRVDEQDAHAEIRLARELAHVVALAQHEAVLADRPAVERHIEVPFARRSSRSRGAEREHAATRLSSARCGTPRISCGHRRRTAPLRTPVSKDSIPIAMPTARR